MTADPQKRQITMASAANVKRMAQKPGYVVQLEAQVKAANAGPFDAAGGAFPFDIPSQAFDFHLRKLDELIDQAEHQIGQLRALSNSIRDVAEGRIAEAVDPPHDPSIHEPPPPPEMTVEATAEEIEAEVIPPIVVVQSTLTWVCPVHGEYAEAISRKNRPYRYCPRPDCGRLDLMI